MSKRHSNAPTISRKRKEVVAQVQRRTANGQGLGAGLDQEEALQPCERHLEGERPVAFLKARLK